MHTSKLMMPPEHWQRFDTLANQLEALPATEAQYFLQQLHEDGQESPQVLRQLDYFCKVPRIPVRCREGTHLGDYQLIQLIGEGGMGAVYSAQKTVVDLNGMPLLPRRVAIKLLNADLFKVGYETRFLKEIQLLGELNHPHIGYILDAGIETDPDSLETTPYYVMRLIEEAQPLCQYAQQQALTLTQRLTLFLSVCKAIEYIHQKDIIHGDLKPDNILVDAEGTPCVIDFGLAQLKQQQADQPCLGTPAYMSPERFSGKLTVSSDLYALGVILFELLADQLPYDLSANWTRLSWQETAEMIAQSVPKRLRQIHPDCPRELELITRKALHKAPSQRYASAAELHTVTQAAWQQRQPHPPLLTQGKRSILYCLALGMGITLWGYVNPSEVAIALAGFCIQLGLILTLCWLFLFASRHLVQTLSPLWNNTFLMAILVSAPMSVISGLCYAFGPPASTLPTIDYQPLWYVQLLRFVVFGFAITLFYGGILAISTAKQQHVLARTREWRLYAGLVLLGIQIGHVYLMGVISHLPVLSQFLSTHNQGGARHEIFVLYAASCIYLMLVFENWRLLKRSTRHDQDAISGSQFWGRILMAWVSLISVNAWIASLFWGQELIPDESDYARAFSVTLLLFGFNFGAYYLFTGHHGLICWLDRRSMVQWTVCWRGSGWIERLAEQTRDAWYSR